MKEKCAAWFHLAVNKFQMFESLVDAIHVGACLITSLVVVYAPHQVRPSNPLQTAIFFGCPIDCNQTTRHVRKQTTVRVPVTIVLMPLPRSTDKRFLQHHLVMVMINLTA